MIVGYDICLVIAVGGWTCFSEAFETPDLLDTPIVVVVVIVVAAAVVFSMLFSESHIALTGMVWYGHIPNRRFIARLWDIRHTFSLGPIWIIISILGFSRQWSSATIQRPQLGRTIVIHKDNFAHGKLFRPRCMRAKARKEGCHRPTQGGGLHQGEVWHFSTQKWKC